MAVEGVNASDALVLTHVLHRPASQEAGFRRVGVNHIRFERVELSAQPARGDEVFRWRDASNELGDAHDLQSPRGQLVEEITLTRFRRSGQDAQTVATLHEEIGKRPLRTS